MDRERAFQVLFRDRTIELVWHWLERLAVPARDRWDVLQEVFFAAFRSFPTYDPMRSRPERWLNKITVYVAAHYLDRALHRREELVPELAVREIDPAASAPERMQAEQERLLLLDLLRSIDPDLRSVLVAHDIDGIPMAEIAEQHGIPESTAYKWRARALAALRSAYQEWEEEHG